MVNAIVILASLVGASAFTPSRVSRSSSALKMSYENELGVLPPTGFWDPLGLSKDADAQTFTKYRTAELKHGRVAMLAVVGLLVQSSARLPGTIDLDGTTFASIPNGLDAFNVIPAFGWFQIAASVGWWEIFGWKQNENGPVGDFSFYAGNKALPEGAERVALNNKELQNGRVAMIASAELLFHDYVTKSDNLFDLKFF